jgi:hypothetical protein
MVKPSKSEKTLKIVSADLFHLIEQFRYHSTVCFMHSYKLMQRVLAEQCNLENDKDGKKVTLKNPSKILSDSLQNPSNPDATYSGHKGQGYQVQVMETFSRSEDKAEKQQRLNLITHVAVQTACESDTNALVPAITDTKERQLSPDELLADTLYGSDTNQCAAESDDVQLIAPVHWDIFHFVHRFFLYPFCDMYCFCDTSSPYIFQLPMAISFFGKHSQGTASAAFPGT